MTLGGDPVLSSALELTLEEGPDSSDVLKSSGTATEDSADFDNGSDALVAGAWAACIFALAMVTKGVVVRDQFFFQL